MGAIRDFIEFLKDAFAVTSAVLTSKWIWIIIGFGLYFVIQPLLMLAISPLTVLILPAGLIVYLLWEDNRRTKSQYSMKKPVIETTKWDVTSSVDNYIKTLTRVQILDEDREKDRE